jgi:hypothetical protein
LADGKEERWMFSYTKIRRDAEGLICGLLEES